MAKRREIAVSVFSPPDSRAMLFNFFPGGSATISIPVSKMLSGSVSLSIPFPPLNIFLNTFENSFSIFRRQQKILKSFLKVISKKRNLIKTTQLLKKYRGLLHTSIQFPQLITMIHRFIRMQQLPSKKLFLPLTDTFRVVNREDKKKVIVIDFTRNRNVLHQVAMEKAN